MFDIGWTEMLVVAIIAILFVGPRELPGMLRTMGRSIKKLRAMAGDFQSQFDEALKDAELDGIKDTINDVRNLDPTKQIKDKLNPLKEDLEKTTDSLNSDAAEAFDSEDDWPADGNQKANSEKPSPMKVEADEALERQRRFEEIAKAAQESGTSAVPGFNTAPKPETVAQEGASPSNSAPSGPAKKPSGAGARKAPAKRAKAAPKTQAKSAAKPTKAQSTKKASAAKPKTPAKRKAAKKAEA